MQGLVYTFIFNGGLHYIHSTQGTGAPSTFKWSMVWLNHQPPPPPSNWFHERSQEMEWNQEKASEMR